MNDNISSFDGGDRVGILKDIWKLDQSQQDQTEFVCKSYLEGESILAF